MINNPLNIKAGTEPWRGQSGVDARGHANFVDASYGIRAAVRTIARKAANGKRSLLDLIRDWAPADDTIGSIPGGQPNEPEKYAAFVAARLGVGITEDLAIFWPDGRVSADMVGRLVRLLIAMTTYEKGHGYKLAMSDILTGIGMYLADFVEAKQS